MSLTPLAPPPALDTRKISTEVFQAIKPICVELSQLALLPKNAFRPDSPKLISTVRSLHESLETAMLSYTSNDKLFIISPNLADYIFFPLSNLLQQTALGDKVVEHLLYIIAFLATAAWIPNDKFDKQLVDQLYPVIIHLIKKDNVELVKTKPFGFRLASYTIIDTVLRGIDPAYFDTQDRRRLSLLGDTTTIVLGLMTPLNRPPSEEIKFTTDLILLMSYLFNNMVTTDQLSHIFPGIISHYVNFVIGSRNIHHTVLVNILNVTRDVITNVFGDETLGIKVEVEDTSIEGLALGVEQKDPSQLQSMHMSLESASKDRGLSWLRSMSKQLKISLTILLKDFLLSESNKAKIRTKPKLVEAIQAFVREINLKCFWSLFNELYAFNIDILSLTAAAQIYLEHHFFGGSEQIHLIKSTISSTLPDILPNDYIIREEASVKILDRKIEDLIQNKVPVILMSSSDEKINNLIIALKFHLLYLESFPNTTQSSRTLKYSLAQALKRTLVDVLNISGASSKEANSIIDNSPQASSTETESNKLDNIELPPYVNAASVITSKGTRNTHSSARSHTMELQILANEWSVTSVNDTEDQHVLSDVFSHEVEDQIGSLLSFLAQSETSANEQLTTLEGIFMESELYHNSIQEQTHALWLANNYILGLDSDNQSRIDEFLLTDELDDLSLSDGDDSTEEMKYLLLNKAQDLMEQVTSNIEESSTFILSKSQRKENMINQRAYCLALDCFGTLSNYLDKVEFQETVLMGNLYLILEALTFNFNSMVQEHAKNAIVSIANSYYNGSLSDLIMDNSNYLIESLSMVLSIPGALTPAVSGILLIVLKISGTKLLLENQLNDILQQLFILLDAYHGYSVLVEGFFVVFKVLSSQIDSQYLKPETPLIKQKESIYKPWGIATMDEMLDLISDSNKVVRPFEDYDTEREYFTRPRDAPFSEMDSDDENANQEPEPQETDEWPSDVPQSIYMLVQKIFLYGFKLLTHPSESLKIQILKTMNQVLAILATNYRLLLPILSQNWHILLLLVDGADANVTVGALEFMKQILQTDSEKNETFMSAKFIELWEKIRELSPKKTKAGRQGNIVATAWWTQYDPRLLELLSQYLLEGLKNYERIVPDVTAIHMVEFVMQLDDIKKYELSPGLQNIVWVLAKW